MIALKNPTVFFKSIDINMCVYLAMIINSTVIEIDEDKFWKSLKFWGLQS